MVAGKQHRLGVERVERTGWSQHHCHSAIHHLTTNTGSNRGGREGAGRGQGG